MFRSKHQSSPDLTSDMGPANEKSKQDGPDLLNCHSSPKFPRLLEVTGGTFYTGNVTPPTARVS